MRKNHHIEIGLEGEEIAANFLREKGYDILYKHWTYKHKEVDIIAKYKELLIIAEVKTRSSEKFSRPEEAVNYKKQRFLVEATEAFINDYNDFDEIRFDIISIILQKNEYTIYHIENAFNSLDLL